MRVFLSAFSEFTLAIPMDETAAMVLHKEKMEHTMQYDQKSRSTFISLPLLFNLPEQTARQGIVVREWNSIANKVVLLTADIKRDIEIPDEEFYPMPKTIGNSNFAAMFKGIKFTDKPILLLNMNQLSQVVQTEQQVIMDATYDPSKEPKPEDPPPADTM